MAHVHIRSLNKTDKMPLMLNQLSRIEFGTDHSEKVLKQQFLNRSTGFKELPRTSKSLQQGYDFAQLNCVILFNFNIT